MPSFGRIIGVAEALKTSSVVVCAQHCTHRRHQASTCSRCEQVCPTQAITVSADGPHIDALTCIDCGACASVCPTGALEPLKPTDRALSEWIARNAAFESRVTIACAQASPSGSGTATLTCLARLDPSLLVYAFAKGADSVRLSTGVCDECSARDVASHVSSVVADAQRLLEEFRLPGRIDLREELERSEPEDGQPAGLTRRGLFELLRNGGAKAMGTLLPKPEAVAAGEKPRREDPAHVLKKRERLLESLSVLVPEGSPLRETRGPFTAPELDHRRCDGCAMCARICPTGALGIEEDGDGAMLRITCQESACAGCGLCTEICRQQALSLAPVSTDRVLAHDVCRQTLLERTQGEVKPLHVSAEDRMRKLLGVPIYRT